MLLDLGFSWISSRYPRHPMGPPSESAFGGILQALPQAQPGRYPTGLIEVPMSPASDVVAFRSHRWPLSAVLQALERALTWVVERGLVYDFLCHPSCLVVEDPELRIIQRICRFVQENNDRVRLATLPELAQRAVSAGRTANDHAQVPARM